MLRRATILTALVAVLCMASGAMAGDRVVVKKIDLQLANIDTANYLDGAATLVNDSLTFYTSTFGVGIPWTQVVIRAMVVTADTVFEDDTLGVALQHKVGDETDTIWWTNCTMTKKKEATLNTTPGVATFRGYNDADSTVFDLYRFKVSLIVDIDSIRAHDQTGIVPLMAKYRFYAIFRQLGKVN
jgi:hypothetical protein